MATLSVVQVNMLQFIQVTAQYSNAVLVAILPQISNFVKKADLPMPAPITVRQVAEFNCSPLKNEIGGSVVLTNGLWVLYMQGHVYDFRTPHSYYNLQDAREIPKFYGAVNLNEDEALRFVRSAIGKLGYSLKETFTDQEPEINLPLKIGTNTVPYYLFQWRDPVFNQTAVRIELNAEAKRIEEMRLSSPFFRRAPPEIAVRPVLRDNSVPVSATASNKFLADALPKIAAFAGKLKLPLGLTPGTREVENVEFFNGSLGAWVTLSNGYLFTCEYGAVTEFCAPDSISGIRPSIRIPKPLENYLGKWQLDAGEATEMVRNAIRNLGYTERDFNMSNPPDIRTNQPVGKYVVPRYHLFWITNNQMTGQTMSLVSAEVNADQKRLECLRLFNSSIIAEPVVPELPLTPQIKTNNSLVPHSQAVRSSTPKTDSETNNPEKEPIGDPAKYLLEHMGWKTNFPRTNPTVKPFNPFE
ncbi:MAG TPA: hypothetical protein VFM25_04955 [Verrucomicrobiae bacterium]|nr:hypothetical protein [Verrucomicrobiae bacterium]